MFKQELILKLVRFALVGAGVTGVQALLTWYFSSRALWSPRASYWASYFPALTLHFFLTKWWTFRTRSTSLWPELSRYAFATLISASVQYGLYHLSSEGFGVKPPIAVIIANLGGTALSFILLKWGVFEKKTSPEALAK